MLKITPAETSAGVSRQGYKDSNLEMTESESAALPFGDSPIYTASRAVTSDIIAGWAKKSSGFFKNFWFFIYDRVLHQLAPVKPDVYTGCLHNLLLHILLLLFGHDQ